MKFTCQLSLLGKHWCIIFVELSSDKRNWRDFSFSLYKCIFWNQRKHNDMVKRVLRLVYMSHETSLPWPEVWRKSRQCCTSLSQGNSLIIICNIIQKENICHKNKIHNVILSGMWNLRIIASLMRLSNLMIGICIGSLIFNTWYLCESEHVV